MISLVRPCKSLEDKIVEFREEFLSYGEKSIPGSELLDKMESFDEWLKYVEKNRDPNTVSSDWVVSDTFIALDEDSVVGIIVLRHELTDFLGDFGHVGFSVRPTRRREGIAVTMLEKVLAFAEDIGMCEVQLSCMDDNIASHKCIISCGGKFLRKFDYLGESASVYILRL